MPKQESNNRVCVSMCRLCLGASLCLFVERAPLVVETCDSSVCFGETNFAGKKITDEM